METSKERILKAINHVQPETTPLHIMGFEEIAKWLERFEARDDFDLRDKLGLDLQTARALYQGPNIERGLSIWGTNPDVSGYAGVGYNQVREGHPLAEAASVADIEGFAWPDPDDFDYEIVGEVLQAAREKAYEEAAMEIYKASPDVFVVHPVAAIGLFGAARDEL